MKRICAARQAGSGTGPGIWLLVSAMLALPGFAQDKGGAKPGNGPAAAAGAPAGNAPAPAKDTPAGNAPASAATPPASTSPAGGAKKVTVRVPSGGDYSAYIQEASGAPTTVRDKADLDLPADAKQATLIVLDPKSGYAAKKALDTASLPAEVSLASADFKLVQKVRVHVTGKEDRPIAAGSVTLTDSDKGVHRQMIQSSSQGDADFDMIPSGAASLTVAPDGGSTTTKEVTIDLPKGETVQTIPVALPEVTNTVAPAAAPAPANGPAPAPANTPAAQPSAPPQQAPAQPLPPPQPSGFGETLIGFIFLAGLLFAGYMYMKNRGITVEMLIKKLGVQPDTVVAGGGSLAGANLATGGVAPGPAPAPPPIVADPNQCPYCGQMKDPSGGCACVVTKGAAPAHAGAAGGFGGPVAGSGPRLVGMAGTYMGQVFPIQGLAVIGREPSNPIPLDRDTTASRRHAQITDMGGSYQLQDLGSANGTFVNGSRVTEATLRPGDEVSIGGTRFRFEV